MSDREMRAMFKATDEGVAAWLYGVVDTLLMGDTLQPKAGDTRHDLAMQEKGRAYRDQAMKMLKRLSGLDENQRQVLDGAAMWPSQNALSAALWEAVTDGVGLAGYAAPRWAEMDDDDPRSEVLVEQIVEVLEANPNLRKILEEHDYLADDDEETS